MLKNSREKNQNDFVCSFIRLMHYLNSVVIAPPLITQNRPTFYLEGSIDSIKKLVSLVLFDSIWFVTFDRFGDEFNRNRQWADRFINFMRMPLNRSTAAHTIFFQKWKDSALRHLFLLEKDGLVTVEHRCIPESIRLRCNRSSARLTAHSYFN